MLADLQRSKLADSALKIVLSLKHDAYRRPKKSVRVCVLNSYMLADLQRSKHN
jgi:hypothetical protein